MDEKIFSNLCPISNVCVCVWGGGGGVKEREKCPLKKCKGK